MFTDPDLTRKIRALTSPELAGRAFVWAAHVFAVSVVTLIRAWQGDASQPNQTSDGDRLLKVGEAVRLFGVSRTWLYEHGDELGLSRRPPGTRGVLFSEKALRHWRDTRRD